MTKTAIIKTDIFTIRTKGCEVEIINKDDDQYLVKILKQPNVHKKALGVGREIWVHKLDLLF